MSVQILHVLAIYDDLSPCTANSFAFSFSRLIGRLSVRFMGAPAQPDQDQFRFRRAAFYSVLRSKVGLIAAKAAALRFNMNTGSCLCDSLACCV